MIRNHTDIYIFMTMDAPYNLGTKPYMWIPISIRRQAIYWQNKRLIAYIHLHNQWSKSGVSSSTTNKGISRSQVILWKPETSAPHLLESYLSTNTLFCCLCFLYIAPLVMCLACAFFLDPLFLGLLLGFGFVLGFVSLCIGGPPMLGPTSPKTLTSYYSAAIT